MTLRTESLLVAFFYELLRDHVVAGKVEKIVLEDEAQREQGHTFSLTNEHLGRYATELTERLTVAERDLVHRKLAELREENIERAENKAFGNCDVVLARLAQEAMLNLPNMETLNPKGLDWESEAQQADACGYPILAHALDPKNYPLP